jgi:hypothetical protein
MNGITWDNWAGVTVKDGIGISKNDLYSASSFPINYNGENISTANTAESAADAYDHVISFAGNGISPNKRTAIDQQCAAETKNGTGQCSGTAAYDGSEANLNKYNIKCGVTYSYPSAVTKKEITDADNDGMDDNWETKRGLDPSDPTDYAGDYCGQGYMNIEYYINDLTVDSFPKGVVKLSPEGDNFTPIPTVSAFETIEAESFTEQNGLQTEKNDDFSNIGYIENGDWAMYRRVDFGSGAQSIKMKLSGYAGAVELYTDSLSGSPVAKVNFAGTGSFTDYEEIEAGIPKISGTHNLYLKFTGGSGYLVNVDNFVFSEEPILMSGELFKNVEVAAQANPLVWQIGGKAAVGSLIFGDRAFKIAELSADLEGAEMLLTSCDAKGTKGETATFTAGSDMELYVGLDSRVEKVPEWLSEHTLTEYVCKSDNDVTFKMCKREVKAGEKISLGSNGQTYMCVNYIVMGVPVKSAEPVYSVGDINNDGAVGVADLVMLQNHLLGRETLTQAQASFADLNGDGAVDVFDSITLRKLILANS